MTIPRLNRAAGGNPQRCSPDTVAHLSSVGSLALIQADGRRDLENDRRGDATDLYGAVDGVALSDETAPSSRLWDGSDSVLVLSNISGPGERIQFRAGQAPPVSGGIATATGRADPDALIPDNQPEGIESAIDLDPRGRLVRISVSVDLTHTWRGDLRIQLRTPSQKTITLRGNDGAPGLDLAETYDSTAGHEGLVSLEAELVEGPWSLRVQDRERRDVGRLNSWSIEVGYEPAEQAFEDQSDPDLEIPDNDPAGANDAIAVTASGALADVAVNVDIEHSFIRDLQVELVAPSGHSAMLHNRTGGSSDDIHRAYSVDDTPNLENLLGQSVEGDWTLRIKDLERRDVGRLKHWSLRIVY